MFDFTLPFILLLSTCMSLLAVPVMELLKMWRLERALRTRSTHGRKAVCVCLARHGVMETRWCSTWCVFARWRRACFCGRWEIAIRGRRVAAVRVDWLCCCEPLKGVENLSSLGCLIPAFELDLGWRGCDLFRGLGWAGDVA
jgi:hypothetical protein